MRLNANYRLFTVLATLVLIDSAMLSCSLAPYGLMPSAGPDINITPTSSNNTRPRPTISREPPTDSASMNWLGNSLVSPENSSGPFFQLEFDPTVWQLLTETRSFLVHRSLADCQIQTTKVGEVGIGDPDFRIEHSNITLGNIQYEKNAIFYKGAVSFFTYFTDAGKSDFYAGFLITAPEHCLKEAEEVLKTLKTVADPTNLATPAP